MNLLVQFLRGEELEAGPPQVFFPPRKVRPGPRPDSERSGLDVEQRFTAHTALDCPPEKDVLAVGGDPEVADVRSRAAAGDAPPGVPAAHVRDRLLKDVERGSFPERELHGLAIGEDERFL